MKELWDSFAVVANVEWPSIVLGIIIAVVTGPAFAFTHQLYTILIAPWVKRKLSGLAGRSSQGS